MKLTFDLDLEYQEQAIRSVTDFFEGRPSEDSVINFGLKEEEKLFHFSLSLSKETS